MKEQREARRVPWVTGVECDEVATGRRHRGARLGDISLTGALVEGLPPLPEGTRLRLHFTLPSLQMDIGATLVRVTPGTGVGLLFHDMTPVHRVVIQELMKPEMADPDLSASTEDAAPAATREAAGELPPGPEVGSASEVEVEVEPELDTEPELESEPEPEAEAEAGSLSALARDTSPDSAHETDTSPSERAALPEADEPSLPDLPPLPEPPAAFQGSGESPTPGEPSATPASDPDASDPQVVPAESPALEPPLPETRPIGILPPLGSPRLVIEPPLPGGSGDRSEPFDPKDIGSAPTRRLGPGFLTAPPLPTAGGDATTPAAVDAGPTPAGADTSGASGADPGNAAREGGPRPRVLVVDDHDRTRTMLRGMIEGPKKAFLVTEAQDGEDCLRVVAEQEAFDLIFLDVDMPRLDGFQTCRRLRERGVRSPIIFLTGRSEIGDFRAGREAGADTYIKKPIVLGTLRSMLSLFTSGSLQRR